MAYENMMIGLLYSWFFGNLSEFSLDGVLFLVMGFL